MKLGHVKAIVLILWAGFFTWLLISDQIYRYIGPRTYWVVVFGAIASGLAALGYVAFVMRQQDSRVTPRQLIGSVALLLPILLVAVIPEPSLGSLAASRKIGGALAGPISLTPDALSAGERVGFQEISYASESPEYAAALGLSEGYVVEFRGFVSDAETGLGGVFPLTRFSIFCCAADAVPYTIPVQASGPARLAPDTWIEVEGRLTKVEDRWVVRAERIEEIDPPDNPYV